MGACALLMLRQGLHSESWLSVGQAMFLGGAAVLLVYVGTLRGLMLDRGQRAAPPERMIQLVSLCLIAIVVSVALGFWFSPVVS